MKRTGPTNIHTQKLIVELKKKAIEGDIALWKRIAEELEKPTRRRRVVNLSRINRYAKENEVIIVPGKVLGSGELSRKLTISAFTFSTGAMEKIKQSNSKAMTIQDLMKDDPKGKKIRIMG